MLSIRLNNPLQMNDKREVHFFEDYVFIRSVGEKMKKIKEDLKKKVGAPYILSFIYHKRINGHFSHEIPMWWMYGNNYKGIRLRFDFQKLNENIQSKGVLLTECKYETNKNMKEIGKNMRKSFANNYNQDEVKINLKETAVYKSYEWEYENEWRLIRLCKQEEVKYDDNTGRFYYPIELPLYCLNAVKIGPNADKDYIEGCLTLMKEKFGWKDSECFRISKSNLQIR